MNPDDKHGDKEAHGSHKHRRNTDSDEIRTE
jgi:hypothetical protein